MTCPNLRVTPADLGTTDVPHLLDRFGAFEWALTGIENMAKNLLPAAEHGMMLSGQLFTQFGAIDSGSRRQRGGPEDEVPLWLLCAVALGWMTCWHVPDDEDLYLELTHEGRLALRDVYENAANRLGHTAPNVCPGCDQCRLPDREEEDYPW